MAEQFQYSNLTFDTDASKTDLNAFFGLSQTTTTTPQQQQPFTANRASTRQRPKYAGFEDSQSMNWEEVMSREIGPSSQQSSSFNAQQRLTQSLPIRQPQVPLPTSPPPPPLPLPSVTTPSPPQQRDSLASFMSSQINNTQQHASLATLLSPSSQRNHHNNPPPATPRLYSQISNNNSSSQPIQDRWNYSPPPTPLNILPPVSSFKAPRTVQTPTISQTPPPLHLPGKLSASVFFNHPNKDETFACALEPQTYQASDCFQIPSTYNEVVCIPGPASFYNELTDGNNVNRRQQSNAEEEEDEETSVDRDAALRHARYFAPTNSAWNKCKQLFPQSCSIGMQHANEDKRIELLLCVICKMSFFDKHYAVALLALENGETIEAEIAPNAMFDMRWKEGTVLVLRDVALCRSQFAASTAIVTGANIERIFTPQGDMVTGQQQPQLQQHHDIIDLSTLPAKEEEEFQPLPLLPAASTMSSTNAYQRNLRAMEAEENWEELAALLTPTSAAPLAVAAAAPSAAAETAAPPPTTAPTGNDISWLDDE